MTTQAVPGHSYALLADGATVRDPGRAAPATSAR